MKNYDHEEDDNDHHHHYDFFDDSDDNDDDDDFVGESQPTHPPAILHLSTGEYSTLKIPIILNSILPKIHDYPLPMIMIRWMFTIFCVLRATCYI